MNQERTAAAVEICLAAADAKKQPFYEIGDFIDALKQDPAWTKDEIIEVEKRVLRALLDRIEKVKRD